MPVPEDLPAPVERFVRTLYGDEAPVIETAVVTGRGAMRVGGVRLPVRFRFSHRLGEAYRHDIGATLCGARILTVREVFRDGAARLELPFGVSTGANVDQGANLALWAQAVWMPGLWVTDPRVAWQAADEHTAPCCTFLRPMEMRHSSRGSIPAPGCSAGWSPCGSRLPRTPNAPCG